MLTLLYRRFYLIIGWVVASAATLLLVEAGLGLSSTAGWAVVFALPVCWAILRPWLTARLFLPRAARRNGWQFERKPLRLELGRREVGDIWREYDTSGEYRDHRFGFHQEHWIRRSPGIRGGKIKDTLTQLEMPLPEDRNGHEVDVDYHFWGLPKRSSVDELRDEVGVEFADWIARRPGFGFTVGDATATVRQPGPIGLVRLRLQMRFLIRVMQRLPPGTVQPPPS